MPTEHIVSLLIAERDRLNRAIEALQGPTRRRGRPPKGGVATVPLSDTTPKKRKRRTAAQRKAQAASMRAYWAAKRKKEATHK